MLYKVVLTFDSVDEILKCDHSNESYCAVLSCGTVYYAVQAGSNFRVWMKVAFSREYHYSGKVLFNKLRTKMTNLLFLQSLCPQFDCDNTSLLVSFLASLVLDWVYDGQLLADLLDKTKSS